MECMKRPNGSCPHASKNFEQLSKAFPYFDSTDLKSLQYEVCCLCRSEWNIPRFKKNLDLTNSKNRDTMSVQTKSKGDNNMAKTAKVLNDEIKTRFLDGVSEHLTNVGEEVLRTGSNEIAVPVVDEDGNEKWLVLTFKVPTGSREGDAYDGYSMAEDYQMKQAEKEAKAKAKAEKAKKDKAKREAKAKEKAEG